MVHNNNSKTSNDSINDCAHNHLDFLVLDERFPVDIETLFKLLFTDSHLYRKFIKLRNTFDVQYEDWPAEAKEDGSKTRTLKYTLSISYSIGPKSTPSTEIQIMYPESKPESNYLIDANCQNHGIPYADNFYTSIRYCIQSLGKKKTRLFITGKVIYMKSTWPLIKNLIEKTAVSGCETSFRVLSELLWEECEPEDVKNGKIFAPTNRDFARRPFRHKRRSHEAATSHATPYYAGSNIHGDLKYKTYIDAVSKFLLLTLVILSIVNACLYYQLSALEASVKRIVEKSHDNLEFSLSTKY